LPFFKDLGIEAPELPEKIENKTNPNRNHAFSKRKFDLQEYLR
jgi:hypothetical protein